MKLCKALSMILGVTLLSSSIMVGCGSKEANTKGTSTSQAASTQTAVNRTPDEISIFYGTAGVGYPEGVKLSDNPYLNKIAELANVKFKEVTVPEYADFETKFNLMVSTGDIPDFVHCWYPITVQTQGASGAFMELSGYYSKLTCFI